jgi:hypothetical protein
MKPFKRFLLSEAVWQRSEANKDAALFIRILQHCELTYDSTNDPAILMEPHRCWCEYPVPGPYSYRLKLDGSIRHVNLVGTSIVAYQRHMTFSSIFLYSVLWVQSGKVEAPLRWGEGSGEWNQQKRTCLDIVQNLFGNRLIVRDQLTQKLQLQYGPSPKDIPEFLQKPYVFRRKAKQSEPVSDYKDPFETGSEQSYGESPK